MITDWLIILPVIGPLCAIFFLSLFRGHRGAVTALSWATATAGLAAGILLMQQVFIHGPQAVSLGSWPAPFGIVFAVDLLSAAMVSVTWLIGLGVLVHAAADLDSSPSYPHFNILIHCLLAGVSGAFLTGDLFNLYVWFEVMLVASFGLMVLDAETKQIHGSLKYVFLNLISTLILLLAIGLLYGATGVLNLAALHLKIQTLPPGLTGLLTGLFLLAFSIKSALFPVFAWLPASYPTLPSSIAALFAGLLTKVGIYAMIRLFTLVLPFEGSIWQGLLIILSGMTMLTGVLGAIGQVEIKRILSFHIISQVGYIIIGIALYTRLALAGSILYLIHHIIVKANLFLVGGFLNRKFGSDRLSHMGGVYPAHPWVALMFMVPAFSLAGFPPLSGFWSKFTVIRASFESGHPLLGATALFVGILTVYSMFKIWNSVFWERAPKASTAPLTPKETSLYLIPVGTLALATVLIGIFAEPAFQYADLAAAQLLDPTPYINAVLGGSQ